MHLTSFFEALFYFPVVPLGNCENPATGRVRGILSQKEEKECEGFHTIKRVYTMLSHQLAVPHKLCPRHYPRSL